MSNDKMSANNNAVFEQLANLSQQQTKLIGSIHNKKLSSKDKLDNIIRIERVGKNWLGYVRLGTYAIGQILSEFKTSWKDLPISFSQAYSGGFYEYAQQKYGLGDQMADMYISVWEAFFSGRYLKKTQIPGFVDLMKPSVVKLYLASTYITKGKMNEKRWRLLANDQLSPKELRNKLKLLGSASGSSPKRTSGGSSGLQIVMETGDIRKFVSGNIKNIGHLDVSSTDPEIIEEINSILRQNRIRKV